MLARHVLALWSALVLGSVEARAEPSILVVPYQGLGKGITPELSEQTTVAISQELENAGLKVIRADASPEEKAKEPKEQKSAPGAQDPGAAKKAQQLIAQAQAAMEDSELDAAISNLDKATKLLEANAEAVPDLRLLAEAYLQLGVAYFQNGDEDQGDEALGKAIHLDPDKKLDGSEYPPIFLRVYERSRYDVLRRPRASIEVKAPAGAQLLLDGRNLGKTPMVLEEVLPGTHWIRIERAGEASEVQKVMVRSKRSVVVEFGGAGEAATSEATGGLAGAIAANQIEESNLGELSAMAKAAGADFVLFGGIYKTETAYNIYSALIAPSGEAGRVIDIAFDLDMLTAQIEVFKLVEDVKKQATDGKLAKPAGTSFALAAQLKVKKQTRVASEGSARVQSVKAAPAPIEPPKAATIDEQKEDPNKRGPMVAAGTKAAPKDDPGLAIKDEDGPKTVPPSIKATTHELEPKDDEDDGDSGWILWLALGVAAAGAAGAGTYFLASQGSSDQATLQIRW
ncbi:MAG: PEGA domain-containing protein [Deltaproteobacteria bacterium]|nr:PEGA domain-containing protein [Deltaproteobacteria bacterium]